MATKHAFGRWYHGWNIVAACILIQASALVLTMNTFSLFIREWSRDFGAPVSTLALSILLFSVASSALAYFIGVCAARLPARRLFGFGLVLLAATLMLVARTTAAWQITAIYGLLVPLAVGLNSAITSQALVSRWFLQRSGVAFGLNALGLAVGGMIFPPIIVELLPVVGWRMIWTGGGLLVLLITLPVAMLVVRDRPLPEDPSIYARPAEGQHAVAESLPLGGILRRLNYWMILMPFLAMVLIATTVSVDIAPILSSYGGTAAMAGLFISVFSGAQLVAMLGSGWLADRIGSRVPLALASLVSGGGAFLLAVPETHVAYLVGVALAMGGVGACWTLVGHGLVAEFGQATFARAFGFACALAPVGTVAPPLVAHVAERTGSYAPALVALGLIAFAAAAALLLFYRSPLETEAAEPS